MYLSQYESYQTSCCNPPVNYCPNPVIYNPCPQPILYQPYCIPQQHPPIISPPIISPPNIVANPQLQYAWTPSNVYQMRWPIRTFNHPPC